MNNNWAQFASFVSRWHVTRNHVHVIAAVNRYNTYDEFLDAFMVDEVSDFIEAMVFRAIKKFKSNHPYAVMS